MVERVKESERNNYKQNFTWSGMSKRGQTTIFVIVAIVIVAGIALIYLFYPRLETIFFGIEDPSDFLRNCVKEDVLDKVEMLSEQGGYSKPEGFIEFEGRPIKYLCYNAQYYLPCVVQQPLIKSKFEKELTSMIRDKADSCIRELKESYEQRGYRVSEGAKSGVEVNIVPRQIVVDFMTPLQITKDTTQKFDGFDVSLSSELYSLLMVAISILDYEATYGDSETTLYMRYYPNLRVEKLKLGDGSKIFTITDVTTQERFRFATRSLAWPGGYGFET